MSRGNRHEAADHTTHGFPLRVVRTRGFLRRLGFPGLVMAAFLVLAAVPDLLAPYPVGECMLDRSLQAPSLAHPFGTDLQGCDYLTRTLHGARTSIVVGGAVILGAIVIAAVLGTAAGWYGRWADALITRTADVMFSIPILLSALVVFGITEERSVPLVILVLTLFAWPPMVRLVRGAVREQAALEHVAAARALGAGSVYLLRRHVLPDSMRPVLAFALPYAATIVSLEAVLSFVGAGLQLPTVSWGLMLANMGGRLGVGLRLGQAPHLIIPALALVLLVWSLVQVGHRLGTTEDAPTPS